jgi:ABC-2 type transport system permease protein
VTTSLRPVDPPTTGRTGRPMSLLRLEALRMVRTHRWLLLVGVHVLFGVVGPFTARYIDLLMQQVGGEMTVITPDPRPVDGLVQYVSNASQIGILAIVVVAAGALAFDGHPERAAFLRTRVTRAGTLLVPPYVVVTVTTVGAYVAGTAVAVALSVALLGPLPVGGVVVGTLLACVYLAFAVAVVAVVASFVRTQIGTVLAGLGSLIALPMLATIGPLRPWLPSELVTATLAMVEGAPASDHLRAALVAVLATVGALGLAASRLERREL